MRNEGKEEREIVRDIIREGTAKTNDNLRDHMESSYSNTVGSS